MSLGADPDPTAYEKKINDGSREYIPKVATQIYV